MLRNVQALLKRVSHYGPHMIPCSVSYSRSLSLKNTFTHHISYTVFGMSVVPRLLPNVMVCNKWSKNISSLIQHSPMFTNYMYCNGVTRYYYTTQRTSQSRNNRSTLVYTTAIAIVVLGLSYAAVPLYRMFCQVMLIPCSCKNLSICVI